MGNNMLVPNVSVEPLKDLIGPFCMWQTEHLFSHIKFLWKVCFSLSSQHVKISHGCVGPYYYNIETEMWRNLKSNHVENSLGVLEWIVSLTLIIKLSSPQASMHRCKASITSKKKKKKSMTSRLDFHKLISMRVEWSTEVCGSPLWSHLRLKIDTKCVLYMRLQFDKHPSS